MAQQLVHGRYRPLERHAVGGMATLWRAKDERTGEIVALKRLHPYLVADAAARERLEREAAALRTVDHPAIVRPRELIDDPDDPALVMDFAAGRSLANRIAEDGPLDPDEAVAIAGTIADALAVAHRAGIVHRDVKPANILVEDSGAVHLVDFGIASLAEPTDLTLTATRTIVGTLRYTAPERMTGGRASPRSDVWALGAVLYEMLTGEPAVTGEDATAVVNAGAGTLRASHRVPPAIAAIVSRAMSREPADRYPDAGAFRDALDALDAVDPDGETAVIAMGPAVARPIASPVAAWSPVDREASVFFGIVAVVTLAAVVVLGIGGGGQPPGSSPVPVLPSVAATADVVDVAVTPSPDADDDRGKGNEKDRGRGNEKAKGDGDDD